MKYGHRALTLLACFALLGAPGTSRACGGFFCSNFPIDQVAENILFVADKDAGTVTTHVQILYNGSAPDFAWILPVPDVPELGVSHNEIFSQLQFATQPTFFLNFDEESECGFFNPVFRGVEEAAVDFDDGVQVVASERVGPYETVVIRSDDPNAILNWLEVNGYQLDALGTELLTPYIEQNFVFLALRLASDRDVGDIQPIAMTFAADNPGIPIRLTAIAAQDDMGVRAWILGQDRAIPTNYLHVHINEALINWFNGGFNYDEVVTAAADEADGQAFVTDYAGPSKIMENRIIWDRRFDGVDRLRTVEEPNRFISGLLEAGLPRDQQMQALLRRHIPIPPAVMSEGVLRIVFRGDEAAFNEAVAAGLLLQIAESSFYNNIDAYSEYTGDLEFDPNSFIDDVEEIIINPLREAQQLFEDYPYLTRLYTTLSPEEMTVDPMFSFNPDLPEISNMRTAHGRWECTLNGEELPFEEWVLVVTLKDGREIRSTPFSDIGPQPLPIGPAAVLIEQLDESGPPETVRRATFAAGSNQGELPEDFTLAENYPNPFNSGTVLPFKVPAAAAGQKVSLRVYNLLGQPIRTLVQHPLSPGPYEIAWDGLTEAGEAAPSGTYFYRLKTGSMQLTRKLMLLR